MKKGDPSQKMSVLEFLSVCLLWEVKGELKRIHIDDPGVSCSGSIGHTPEATEPVCETNFQGELSTSYWGGYCVGHRAAAAEAFGAAEFFFYVLSSDHFSYRIWCLRQINVHIDRYNIHTEVVFFCKIIVEIADYYTRDLVICYLDNNLCKRIPLL
jgi:hypothetical protein